MSESSSSSSSPSNSPLLLYDALTVYLQPLLDKHASHNPTLVYEDLTASWHAVERFLLLQSSRKGKSQLGEEGKREEEQTKKDLPVVPGKKNNDDDEAAVAAVRKHVAALHRGQVQAYRDAAIVALQEYALKAPLPPLEDMQQQQPLTRDTYVQLCCDAILQGRPGWKVGTGILERNVASTVRQRAGEVYDQRLVANQQQHQQPPVPVPAPTEAANDEEEDGEVEEEDGEEGEIEEGGEDVEDGEEGEVEESGPSLAMPADALTGTASAATADTKRQGPMAAKRKRSLQKAGKAAAAPPRKTVKASAPALAPARPNTRLGNRRGRGGSNAAASK